MSYSIAVRSLCEFTAKQGDLDMRFTPSPSAQEGLAGHALVRARRGDRYQAEVSLNGEWGPLRVRGRADGYDPVRHLLEEVKTYRGDLAAMPDNYRQLHWAQARIYAHLMCCKLGCESIDIALVYVDVASGTETSLLEHGCAKALAATFADHCARFAEWAAQEQAHRAQRDAALCALSFPHPAFREGQRRLAQAAYRTAERAGTLLLQAPTGAGKTLGALFGTLKAMPAQSLDKVFFLTARTPGRQVALDAAATFARHAPGLPLRVIELVAREKACELPGTPCHGDACPLARGFYDRLPQARRAAAALGLLTHAALREVALAHQLCPYYLASEMTRWSDLVVGDYNYYFDAGALLHGLSSAGQWRVSLLVDEAHNLLPRARAMYSAGLTLSNLRAARALAPALLKKPLDKLARRLSKAARAQGEPYRALAAPPDTCLSALQEANSAMAEHLAQNAVADPALLRWHFDALHFAQLGEQFGAHSLCDLASDGDIVLSIRNVIPAPFLQGRFGALHGCTLMSATLTPWHFYADTLGLPAQTAWLDIDSAFDRQQLAVHVASDISTRYQSRSRSVAPIATLIARQFAAAPGNYLAFFSSFDYLEQVLAALAAHAPQIPLWQQTRRMDEAARTQFLARFTERGQGIGFAVLGGAFGEGIDLPGERLIGAFIATLGLPQKNPVNEQIRARMDGLFGAGYDYTYLYPGIQKVVQAAGRVIRTPHDRGVVHLIDERYARAEVRALLPPWWGLGAPNGRAP